MSSSCTSEDTALRYELLKYLPMTLRNVRRLKSSRLTVA